MNLTLQNALHFHFRACVHCLFTTGGPCAMLTLKKKHISVLATRIEAQPFPCRFGNNFAEVIAVWAQRLQLFWQGGRSQTKGMAL